MDEGADPVPVTCAGAGSVRASVADAGGGAEWEATDGTSLTGATGMASTLGS